MKKLGIIIGLFVIGLNCDAQSVQIRQTFETSDGKSAPAQVQLSFPELGKSSYLIDAAVALKINFLQLSSVTAYFTAEYHRNTLISLPQNNYQLGYNLRWFERSARPESNWRNVITANLKYVGNQTDSTHSFALTANWTWYRKNRDGLQLNRPGYLSRGAEPYAYTYNLTPYLGTQYQQFFMSNAAMHEGATVRGLGNLSGAIALNKKYNTANGIKQPQKNIELFADFTARYAAVHTSRMEGYTKLLKTGINYYFINTEQTSVSLGGNYNLGSDPLNGLKNQQYWQIAFQLQL
jgi:hypothetical protein